MWRVRAHASGCTSICMQENQHWAQRMVGPPGATTEEKNSTSKEKEITADQVNTTCNLHSCQIFQETANQQLAVSEDFLLKMRAFFKG